MNNPDENTVPVDLIARSLSEEAGQEELSQLEEWKALSENNRNIFEQYEELWKKSSKVRDIGMINVDKEWDSFLKQTGNKPVLKPQFKVRAIIYRLSAAAVIAILIGFSTLLIYRNLKFNFVIADSSIEEVILPDGSVVTLNIGSQLSFPKSFSQDERKVKLSGEGFFNISPNPMKAFIVKSSEVIIEVLGTQFNLEAIKGQETVSVIVEEGKVAVYNINDRIMAEFLEKGEKVTYNRQTDLMIKQKNPDRNFNAWKTRIIDFENAGMSEVAETLSKVYNVEIMLEGISVFDNRITVRFEDKDLDYVFKTLQATLNLDIENNDGPIIFK